MRVYSRWIDMLLRYLILHIFSYDLVVSVLTISDDHTRPDDDHQVWWSSGIPDHQVWSYLMIIPYLIVVSVLTISDDHTISDYLTISDDKVQQKFIELVFGTLIGWKNESVKESRARAVVVAQLTEWLLPAPEFCSSNPAFGNFAQNLHLLWTVEKTKINKNTPMEWPIQ